MAARLATGRQGPFEPEDQIVVQAVRSSSCGSTSTPILSCSMVALKANIASDESRACRRWVASS